MPPAPQTTPQPKPKSTWLNLALDFGPLLVFFLAYRHFSPPGDTKGFGAAIAVTKSTAAFMVATVIALIVSRWKLGRIAPTLWLSTILIVGFGTLTVLLGDPFWIQVKPTAIYLLFAAVLFIGLWRGQPMLRFLLETAFEGLSHEGWMKLSRNWAWFFVFLAALNEVLRHALNFETWLTVKVWGVTTLSFLFTFSQLPMLLRHGLTQPAKAEVESHPPHE